MKISPERLISELAATIEPTVARATVESYVEMQQRFMAGDWKPSELDGGRLCEAISRALLQLDIGRIDHKLLPGRIRDLLLDQTQPHNLSRDDRNHITSVIGVVYKFRSARGAVHISPNYTANQMDSMLVLHAGKWIFAEFLRLAWNRDREAVAGVIAQLVQLTHPLIHELDGKPLVLASRISAPEEVLLLLHHAENKRLTRTELKNLAPNQNPKTVASSITRLIGTKEIRPAENGEVAITPLGEQRVVSEIIPKYSR